MKQLISLSIAALMAIALTGQEPVILKAPVTAATLYPDRAQLNHSARITIPAGTTVLLIENLPRTLQPATLRAEGAGDFMIMSVNPRANYLADREETEEITSIRLRIAELQILIEDENTEVGILKEKEAFLTANRVVTGGNGTISAEQYRLLSEQYASGIEGIRKGIVTHNRKIRAFEEEKKKLENQLSDETARNNLPGFEVLITVSSSRQITGQIDLSYLVRDAGWFPSYDIRVTGPDAPATIFYKANAWQNSGFDWENIKCSFSSASPAVSGTLPVLYPWYISFKQENVIMIRGTGTMKAEAPASRAIADASLLDAEEESAIAPPVTFTQGMNNFSFDLETKQDIPSGTSPAVIELQRITTDAFYRYIAIPKLREEAYLTASITEWESLNLLDGVANIYYGNTFTGKSNITASALTDTLDISLGPDKSVTVKREKRKDVTTTRLIGTNKEETRSYLITVRNNRTTPAIIVLHDQIPISTNNQISVEPRELSGGVHDTPTGKIKWDLTIAPGETRELILEYRVRFPKGETVILER
ncbi:MAG: DUF4139 domain-containing protein [Bacteroidales bacterium]|nr:DUF4139 domain-containing protein [Bacteroidales bacterium]